MKFSHVLKYNSVPEWREAYINYPLLKKLILAASAAEYHEGYEGGLGLGHPAASANLDEEVGARSPLLASGSSAGGGGGSGGGGLARSLSASLAREGREKEFLEALDAELAKIIRFYLKKEAEISAACEEAGMAVAHAEGIAPPPPEHGADDAGLYAAQRCAFWSQGGRAVAAQRERLKAQLEELFATTSNLANYVETNRTGFRKILKKHDKLVSHPMGGTYLPIVDQKFPESHAATLRRQLEAITELYAIVACNGKAAKAATVLRKQQAEQVSFERSSIWKDMVGQERRGATLHVQDGKELPAEASWLARHRQALLVALSLAVFAGLLSAPVFEDSPEKHNCLALLGFAATLWCTEAIPLFVTSMLVPLLIVVLRVLCDADAHGAPVRLEAKDAAARVFHTMFSQTIMLLLGGFAIAAALSKHFIAKQLAVAILSRVGRRPRDVLLANMLVATFASMWISNVAAPVLCFSLVTPILRTLPTSHPFCKSLVMGIALASNLGGMTSPISSPQNIFAIERMSIGGAPPSWLAWFGVALPVAFLGNLACWGLLLLAYRPGATIKEVRPLKPPEDPLNATQLYVIFVSLATVGAWCFNSLLAPVTGEMGVLAIVPCVAFFGFGVLSKDDFNGFLWNVVMLAMGGLALGEAVASSGLLATISSHISALVAGQSLWAVLAIFCGLVLVGTTFISHTVGAMVILPVVQSVGEAMPGGHARLLVMGAALMCSGAMGLPVSGFPNMNAVALEDSTGVNYVDTGDFLKVGLAGSVAAYGLIVSAGYGLMLAVGF
ncbi:SPBC3B8.04c [Scenedesmus sp. PABB004]|nr:SPBC3B8.04c [Scenedesmus sp. PABB004]